MCMREYRCGVDRTFSLDPAHHWQSFRDSLSLYGDGDRLPCAYMVSDRVVKTTSCTASEICHNAIILTWI